MALTEMPGVNLTPMQRQICALAYDQRFNAEYAEQQAAEAAQKVVRLHLKAAEATTVAEEWRAFALEHTGIDVNELT